MVNDRRKKRITIAPPVGVVEKLDEMAERLGMSRSAMATFMIVQGLESYSAVSSLSETSINNLMQLVGMAEEK